MENFRRFQAGPDPFGRVWDVSFRYCQNGISIRHSDSVDVGFIVATEGEKAEKVVVLHHPEAQAFCARSGRELTDTWCSRIAALKLKHSIEAAEDLDDKYLPVSAVDLEEYDAAIRRWEKDWLREHAA